MNETWLEAFLAGLAMAAAVVAIWALIALWSVSP